MTFVAIMIGKSSCDTSLNRNISRISLSEFICCEVSGGDGQTGEAPEIFKKDKWKKFRKEKLNRQGK